MTTHIPAQGVRSNFDTGPLSWVMGEIRESLTRSKTVIREALAQDSEARSTSLRHASAYLHQAHGALQIVDIDGVDLLTQTIEDMLTRLESGKLAFSETAVGAIEEAFQAIIEYLEDLLAGASHQPVRLFSYYKALVDARGEGKAYPSDLFFPNLSIRPALSGADAQPQAIDLAALRQRFERVLLPFLKSSDRKAELASAAVMEKLIADVERAQADQRARAFWWVMRGFAEAVSSGQTKNELYVKQLFAHINLELRKLSAGAAVGSERLLRDALFFIAAIDNPSPRVKQIIQTYQLEGQVPADYERRRYGQIDIQALVNAKERLGQAKNLWNRIVGGDDGAIEGFQQEMNVLAQEGGKLNSPSLSRLLGQLSDIARHAARAHAVDNLGLEVATSLLFVENALSHTSRLSDDFAARADAMTARLHSIVAGEKPADAGQWLDDMSREAQQRQTMTALASELQASLGQVEKHLDEYFGNPAKGSILEPIDGILHQIEGALAILDQDDAIRAIRHTRAAVKRFAEAAPDAIPDKSEFQRVAQNVGALSFFIETLQHSFEGAKQRFSFDDRQGMFQANMLENAAGQDVVVEVRVEPLPGDAAEPVAPAAASLEITPASLRVEPAPSVEVTPPSLPDEPEMQILADLELPVLPEEPQEAERVSARPEAPAPDFGGEISLALPDISLPELDAVASANPPLQAPAPRTAAQPELPPSAPAPATDEAIDAELLEIFLSEAEEVLGCVRETLPRLRNEAHNQEHMTTLRRSFHTLKGSGRMVGLMTFGDAAWSIEQVLNLRLSEGRGGSPELYGLLEYAAESLGAWVSELQQKGSSDRNAALLTRAAERVKKGEDFYLDDGQPAPMEAPAVAVAAQNAAQPSVPEAVQPAAANESMPALPEVEEAQMSDADMAAFRIPQSQAAAPADPEPFDLEPIDLDFAADSITLEAPEEETPAGPVGAVPEPADATPLQSAGAEVIGFPRAPASEPKHDDNIKRIGSLEISVPLHNIYLAETDELVRLLSNDLAEWRHEPERNVNILAVHASHSLAGSSATVGFESLQEVAYALEMVLQSLARNPVRLLADEFDTLERSVACLRQMLQKFALCEMPPHEPELVQSLKNLQKDIRDRTGGAASEVRSSVPAFNEPAAEIETVTLKATQAPAAPSPSYTAAAPRKEVPAIAEESLFERAAPVAHLQLPNDELDADLLPVFIEEGNDILPQMGQLLRAWQQDPKDSASAQSLLRLLHTIKGSARMAGAMRIGQHMHEMESRIEQITRVGTPSPEAIEELLGRLDLGLYLFDQLINPDPSKPAPVLAPVIPAAAATAAGQQSAQAVVLPAIMPVAEGRSAAPALRQEVAEHQHAAPAAQAPLVRVRADILDRLVNQAGEVSISRSRVETEVDTLKQSLSELTENVSRLRGQLREIEIQAESQMASQMAQSIDREFDPLEFDRFTRLQELTRMMAESVNDVASVQQNLSKTIDGATTGLSTQARLTRDLQQDLMRVRMVQFASISERLYRVTRQAAKEMDKRVNLDIRGGAVEMDRSVLEKMTGPFEHLLRNAIVHGIESRQARVTAGKREVGELLVEIRQEGNEVVIQFADDGQGLNLARIREKAKTTGLLTDDTAVSDSELKDLIFHPGFSTAQEVTELAGRGVGMDVVRSEAASLGGRVTVMSEPGAGARFVIHLPLTLAVTQVVLLATGGKTYAVPSVLVEQIQQLKSNALAAAYNEGAVISQGNRVPLHYLSGLLGDTAAAPMAQQYSPLVLLKSGNDRVAIHVDEVIGNREVVVKNIGPQLARMIGIAGATVMGSGDIVLIIDPVPLAQRAAQEGARAPRLSSANAHGEMGAVAEMSAAAPATPVSEAVQGLRTQHIVMVVDDSLTVRRVTQRFLTREGYQVVLAKDGVDALEQLQAITPEVMLVDIEMPRMDGFDLTRNIRSDERTRHIPIIMITSRTAAKHRNYAMELGVNEYLGKPYQESDLLKLVSGFIRKEAASI